MQDFYDYLQQNINTNNNAPSIEQLQRQGWELNTRLNDAFDPEYGFNPLEPNSTGFDPLINDTPALAEPIKKLRAQGFRDDNIAAVIQEFLPRLDFLAKKDTVNLALGRTPESMQAQADYLATKQFQAFREAYPHKSDEEIENAIELSAGEGVNPGALLQSPSLYQAFLRGRKETESIWEAAKSGANNYFVTDRTGEIGWQYLLGRINSEDAYLQEQEALKNFIPEPAIKSTLGEFVRGGAQVTAQGLSTGLEGAIAGTGVGAVTGLLFAPFGGGLAGFKTGFHVGRTIGGGAAIANRLLILSAGNSMLELSKLKDENGNPIDENAVRVAALLTGAITVATEMGTLGYTMGLIPGGDKLLQLAGLGRNTIIDTLQKNPVVRDAFSRAAKDITLGIGISTINNVIEAVSDTLARPVAEWVSGQTFPQYDLQLWDNVNRALGTWKDFTASALMSIPFKAAGFVNWARNYNKSVSEIAQKTGLPEQVIDYLNAEKIKQEQLKEAEKADNTPDTTSQAISDNKQQVNQNEASQENAQSDSATSNQNTVPEPDFYFIPKSTWQNFTKKYPQLNNLQTIDAGHEAGFTPEQLQIIRQNAPDFDAVTELVLRNGSDGVTLQEAADKLNATNQDKADIFHSEENQNVIQQTVKAFETNGFNSQQAQDLGNLIGTLNANSLAEEGVPIIPVTVINEAENALDFSRLNPDYDINNPDTWLNRERAQKYSELSKQAQLPDIIQTTKDLLGFLAVRNPDKAKELEAKSDELFKGLTDDLRPKIKSTMRDLLKQELDDYRHALTQSGFDVADTLSTLALNPDKYDINAAFPHGKRRQPDLSYSFDTFGAGAKIDFAVKGLDLFARIKLSGRNEPFTFAVKNYRNADFFQVLDDLTSHKTLAGLNIFDTPLGQFIHSAFNSAWDDLGLHKVDTVREIIPDTKKPQAQKVDIPSQEKPETLKDEFTIEPPKTVRGDVPIDIITSPTDRSKMPLLARMRLNNDESAWRETVEELLTNPQITTRSKNRIHVMQTPGVLHLVGAPLVPLYINSGKLNTIIKHHPTMTYERLVDIVRGVTDPIAIFESTTDGKVILTDNKDENGASIIAAVHIGKNGQINQLASAYPKATAKGKSRNQWFREQFLDGNLLYINRDKAAQWENETGIAIVQPGETTYAQTEADLVNFWNDHNNDGFYYSTPWGEHLSSIFWSRGRAFIKYASSALHNAVSSSLQNATRFVAAVHEIGHNAFMMIQKQAEAGSIQKQQDLQTIIQHAGVALDDFYADRKLHGGPREKVNEYFAQAWEKFLAEGKAPSEKLQPLFERVRNSLLEVYTDIQSQFKNIYLDDDVRDVFNRLLTLPEGSEASVIDFVKRDFRISNQIIALERQRDEMERQFAEAEAARLEFEQHPELAEIDPQAQELVQNYVESLAFADDRQNILQAQQEHDRAVWDAIRKKLGYKISLDDLKRLAGDEAAREIKSRLKSAWVGNKGGAGLDVIVDALVSLGFNEFAATGQAFGQGGGDVNAFLSWLSDFDPKSLRETIQTPKPSVPVNHNTVNAFLASEGTQFTVQYLHERLKHITALMNDDNASTNAIEAYATEKQDINDWLKHLDPAFDEGITPPKRERISPKVLNDYIRAGYRVGRHEQQAIDEIRQLRESRKNEHKLEAAQAKSQQRLEHQQDIADERLARAKARSQDRIDRKNLLLQQRQDEYKRRREADRENYKSRLDTILQRQNEKNQRKISRVNEAHQVKISRLNDRIRFLKQQRALTSQKHRINKLINSILRMSRAKSIRVEQSREIANLLDVYSLKETAKQKKRNDILRGFFTLEQDNNQEYMLENDITEQELDDFLSKIHIDEMKLQDVHDLFSSVKEIYDRGRRAFAVWKNERDNARKGMHEQLAHAITSAFKPPKERVITNSGDLKKVSPLGKPGDLARSFWDAVQTPGNFLAGLGEPFRRLFEDGMTNRRANAHRFIQQRTRFITEGLKSLGLTPERLTEYATTLDGNNYTYSTLMHIFLARRNEKNYQAILWGNFIKNSADSFKPYTTLEQAEAAINQLMQSLPDNYKQAAELFAQDFSDNFDRIQQAQIDNFNRELNREDDYFPMFRLRHQSNQGLIDTETENLAGQGNQTEIMRKVADHFTNPRQAINPDSQQPILLDILSAWSKAVHMQEYNTALAGYASDLASALLLKGDNGSVQDLIKQRVGLSAWNTLKDIFNDSIDDNIIKEMNAVDTIADWFARARSVAYVPFSPSTALAQFSSIFAAVGYGYSRHLLRSIAHAISDGNNFLEHVYQLAPELRVTGGDEIDRAMSNALQNFSSSARAVNFISNAIAKGYIPSSMFDRWTKSIVFDAVYNGELEKGKSQEQAINTANRIVAETQPASTHRQQSRFMRRGGVSRLFFSQFMGSLVPLFNMTVVDTIRNLMHPSWNSVKDTTFKFIAFALSVGFAGAVKDFFAGRLPTGEEQDDGNVDDWPNWIADTEIDNFLNVIPVFNKFIDLYRFGRGKRMYKSEDRFIEPFSRLYKGIRSIGDEDKGAAYSTKEILHGAALLGIPIPYNGFKQWFDLLGRALGYEE